MMKLLWNRARQRREGDDGFTLVELLVVVVIIGILVAIAIPVFLSQREKAWAAASQSDLRNASSFAESWYAEKGTYVGLTKTGMLETTGNKLSVDATKQTATTWCIGSNHDNLPDTQNYFLSSVTGIVKVGNC